MSDPQTYRFVVRSADEAVRVLREKLGENAKVVSVRQVEGTGLNRFLRAPKLEVIAHATSALPEPEPAPVFADLLAAAEPNEEIASLQSDRVMISAPLIAAEKPVIQAPKISPKADEKVSAILQRSGLSASLLTRLKASSGDWPALEHQPLHLALREVGRLLREQFDQQPTRSVTDRIAFIGAAGVGKTTALCKRLASDVFLHRRSACVLKLDTDRPNPGEGLGVFCEALGVPLLRSAQDAETLQPGTTLYIDLPGADLENATALREQIDPLNITTRILVLNAAYESAILKNTCRLGTALGAKHVVLTHFDELLSAGKLWDLLLGQDLTPLFLSSGQNIAGDYTENVFDSVLAKTLPGIV